MEGTLNFDGQKYISAKIAAQNFGYTSDYVGKLCRSKKVTSRLVGRSWYVLESDLIKHKASSHYHLAEISKNDSKQRLIKSKKAKNSSKKVAEKVFKKEILNTQISAEIEKEKQSSYKPKENIANQSNVSRVAEIVGKKATYLSEENDLFPKPIKKFEPKFISPEELKISLGILSGVEKPTKFEKVATRVLALSIGLSFLLTSAFEGGNLARLAHQNWWHNLKDEVGLVYGPYFQNADLDLASQIQSNIAGGNNLNLNQLAAVLTGDSLWPALDWFKNAAYKIAKPWLDNNLAQEDGGDLLPPDSPKVVTQVAVSEAPKTIVQSRTIVVPGSDRDYIDLRIDQKLTEFKKYFLTDPLAPNVNRYYLSRQNDVITSRISNSSSSGGSSGGASALSDLSDLTLSSLTYGDLLMYNGSAWVNIATSSLGIVAGSGASTTLLADFNTWSNTNNFTGKLAIGTSTPYYTLTVASTTGPQVALSAGAGLGQWTLRNAGGNFYLASTTIAGMATTSGAAALSVIGSTGYFGIGTSIPGAPFELVVDNSGFGQLWMTSYGNAGAANFKASRANGTMASPSALLSGDVFAAYGGSGYGATGWAGGATRGNRGSIQMVASENWTDSAQGAYMRFFTTPTGGTGVAERVRIDPYGNLGVATTTPSHALTISSSTAPQLALSVGAGLAQWTFRNAGGNFYLSTTTVAGTATTSISALEIAGDGFGTTTVRGLNIQGLATTTSNVGINLSAGCYAINGTCLSSGSGASSTLLSDSNTFSGTNNFTGSVGFSSSTPFARLSINNTAGEHAFVIGSSTATQFIVDKNGYVGVGTNAPVAPLDIYGPATNDAPSLIVRNTGAYPNKIQLIGRAAGDVRSNWIEFYKSTTQLWTFGNDRAQSGHQNFYLYDNVNNVFPWGADNNKDVALGNVVFDGSGLISAANLIVKYGGNVGISTTTPYYNLTVASTTGAQLSLSAGAGIAQWVQRNAGGNLYFATTTVAGTSTTTTSALAIIGSTGRVGIGTDSPQAGLDIITNGGSVNQIRLGDRGGRNLYMSVDSSDSYIENPTGSLIFFSTPGQSTLQLDNSNNVIVPLANGGGKVIIGTSTASYLTTIASSTAPQLSLGAGAGIAQWTFRNAGGNFYLSTTTVAGTATTSISALEIAGDGFGTTTVRGLNISGQATTTSNVGINLSGGCFAVNGSCISGGVGSNSSSTLLADSNTFSGTNNFTGSVGFSSSTPFARLSINNTAGEHAFVIGSSTATHFMVDKNGWTGIGTANPLSTLHVRNSDSSASAAQLTLEGGSGIGNPFAGIRFRMDAHTTGYGAAIQAEDTAAWKNSLLFKVTNGSNSASTPSEAMRIDYTGRVGIGGTGVDTNSRFTVGGGNLPSLSFNGMSVTNSDNSASGTFYQTVWGSGSAVSIFGMTAANAVTLETNSSQWGAIGNRQNAPLYFGTNDLVRQTITAGGNVGIGSTTPWGLLSVNANGLASGAPQFVVGSSTATNFIVANNGNVGVGTTSPISRLSLNGSGSTNGISFNGDPLVNLYYDGGYIKTDSTFTSGGSTYGYNSAVAGDLNVGVSKLYVNTNAGTVGISTTTQLYALTVSSSTAPQLSLSAGAGIAQWVQRNAGGNLYFATTTVAGTATTSTSALTVLGSSGRIGISTTSPLARLSVESQAGEAAFVVGSSTATSFIVDSQGRVGIGTANPTTNLHLTNNPSILLAGTQNLTITSAASGVGSITHGATLQINGNRTQICGAGCSTSATRQVDIFAGWDATSSHTSSVPVSVNFGRDIGGIAFSVNIVGTYKDSATSSIADFQNNGTSVARLTAAGNFGLGTTTPAWQLSVATTSSNGGFRPQFTLTDMSGTTNQKHWNLSSLGGNFYLGTSTDLYATTSISALEISGSGFGTTTVRGLNISGQATTTSNVGINLSGGCFAINGSCVSGGGSGASSTLLADSNTFSGTNNFTSSVGLASSSPWAQLSINPDGISGPAFAIGSSTATDFIVTNRGNVGIGTTTFSAKLAVVGRYVATVSNGEAGLYVQGSQGSTGTGGHAIVAVGGAGNNGNYAGGGGVFIGGTGGAAISSNAGTGGSFTFTGGLGGTSITSGTSGTGGAINLTAGAGGAGLTGALSGNGGNVVINGGAAGGSGAFAGNVLLASSVGSVGVSTTTPYYNLTVASTTGAQLSLSAGAGIAQWVQRNAGGNLYFATTTVAGTATTSTSALTILGSSGLVGISTTSPFARLSVESQAGEAAFVVGSSTATSLIVDSQGRVGIGTSTPISGAKLEIVGNNNTDLKALTLTNTNGNGNELISLTFRDSVWTTADAAIKYRLLTTGVDSELQFHTGLNGTLTSRMILGKNGAGIGTTTINSYGLTISSSTNAQLSLSAGAGLAQWVQRNAGGNFYLATTTVAGTSTTTVAAFTVLGTSGNIGIATTSPTAKLSLQATISTDDLFRVSSTTGASLFKVNNYGALVQTLSSTTAISIQDSSGNAVFNVDTTQSTGAGLDITAAGGQSANLFNIYAADGTTNYLAVGPSGNFGVGTGTPAHLFTVATSTTTKEPVFDIYYNSSGATSTVGFFVSTTTGSAAGVGLGLPSALANYMIVGNGKVQAGVAIVNGGLCIDNDGWCTASTTGRISSVTSTTGGSDVAEMYNSSEALEPGDVVAITEPRNFVKVANGAAGDIALGIVSTEPGVLLGLQPDANDTKGLVQDVETDGETVSTTTIDAKTINKFPIALAGRVPVKVSIQNGKINPGDYLMLSSTTPGVAVKAVVAGQIVGQALEGYSDSAEGKILIFVKNTYYPGPAQVANVATSTFDQAADLSESEGLGVTILKFFDELGIKVMNGIAYMKNLFVERLTVGTTEKPSGITLYDEDTGDPYCLKIKNGGMVSIAGECLGTVEVIQPITNNDNGNSTTTATTTVTDNNNSTETVTDNDNNQTSTTTTTTITNNSNDNSSSQTGTTTPETVTVTDNDNSQTITTTPETVIDNNNSEATTETVTNNDNSDSPTTTTSNNP